MKWSWLAMPSGPAKIHFSILISPRFGFLFVLSLITNETVKYVPKDAFHRLLENCLSVHRIELWSQCILHCKKASILLQLTTALARRVCGCEREWSRQFSRDIYKVSLHKLCKDRTSESTVGIIGENDINSHFLMITEYGRDKGSLKHTNKQARGTWKGSNYFYYF